MLGIYIIIIDFSLYLCNQYDFVCAQTVFARLFCSVINMQMIRIYI